MTYLQQQLNFVHRNFPDVPIEALKAAMVEGIQAFAWYKEGTMLVGTTGTKSKDAISEVMVWQP